MCLEMLGKVLEIRTADVNTSKTDGTGVPNRVAIVDVDGVARRVSLAVLDLEDTRVTPGDWVLSHTGLALRVLDDADAHKLRDERNLMYASLSTVPLRVGDRLPKRGPLPATEQLPHDGES